MNDTLKKLGIFENFVGQEPLQKRLQLYLESYQVTRYFPTSILCAPKGQGKTTLAEEIAKGLVLFDDKGIVMNEAKKKPERKKYKVINCSTIKNVKAFINGIVIPEIQDKDVTILFDEASELPNSVAMAMLTIINPDVLNTTFSHEDYTCEFDFKRQTLLFATSEPQKMFHALLDRLQRFELDDYTLPQMEKILLRRTKDIVFEDKGIITQIASVLRGNARAAAKMAGDIKIYLRGKTKFSNKDWKAMQEVFNILPMGLYEPELKILRILSENNQGTPLTSLAAQTGFTREALQKDYELYLQKHNLMAIETVGRQITSRGLEYLRAYDKSS